MHYRIANAWIKSHRLGKSKRQKCVLVCLKLDTSLSASSCLLPTAPKQAAAIPISFVNNMLPCLITFPHFFFFSPLKESNVPFPTWESGDWFQSTWTYYIWDIWGNKNQIWRCCENIKCLWASLRLLGFRLSVFDCMSGCVLEEYSSLNDTLKCWNIKSLI